VPVNPRGAEDLVEGAAELRVAVVDEKQKRLLVTALHDPRSNEVLKVGLTSSTVVARLPGGCGTLAADDESVWFDGGCDSTALIRASRQTNQIVERIDIGGSQAGNIRWIALGFGSVWVTTTGEHLLRIDPVANRVVGDLNLEGVSKGTRVAVGAGSMWVGRASSVVRVAPGDCPVTLDDTDFERRCTRLCERDNPAALRAHARSGHPCATARSTERLGRSGSSSTRTFASW